jgi:thioredoxin-like negative regulator of GroEL
MSATQQHDALLDEAAAPRPKLLFVHSERSGRSRRIEGYLAQVLQRRHNHDTFDVVWIDVDQHPALVARLGIESAPALLVVEGQRVMRRTTAPGGCETIRAFLEPWLK